MLHRLKGNCYLGVESNTGGLHATRLRGDKATAHDGVIRRVEVVSLLFVSAVWLCRGAVSEDGTPQSRQQQDGPSRPLAEQPESERCDIFPVHAVQPSRLYSTWRFSDPVDPYKLLDQKRSLGLVVARGTAVVLVSPVAGTEEIANPFVDAVS